MPGSHARSRVRRCTSLAKRGIGHVGLKVSNLEESCKFYREILGLSAEVKNSRTALVVSGHDVIILSQDRSGGPRFHFGFRLDTPEQVDKWLEKIEGSKTPIVQDIRGRNHPRSFKIRDPDGYLIEISSSK